MELEHHPPNLLIGALPGSAFFSLSTSIQQAAPRHQSSAPTPSPSPRARRSSTCRPSSVRVDHSYQLFSATQSFIVVLASPCLTSSIMRRDRVCPRWEVWAWKRGVDRGGGLRRCSRPLALRCAARAQVFAAPASTLLAVFQVFAGDCKLLESSVWLQSAKVQCYSLIEMARNKLLLSFCVTRVKHQPSD